MIEIKLNIPEIININLNPYKIPTNITITKRKEGGSSGSIIEVIENYLLWDSGETISFDNGLNIIL